MTEALQRFLTQTDYFSPLSKAELDGIIGLLGEHRYARSEYLFLEGERARWGGIIIEGQVKLIKHSDTGKDLVIEVLGPGRFLGIESLFGERINVSSAQAMEATRVSALTADDTLLLLKDHPQITHAMMRDLCSRLEEAYQMMRSLALERVERRIALNLTKLAGKIGVREESGAILINLPLSRQDIADMAGTTIETAIRTMSKLQRQGLVELDKSKVRLLKPHQIVLISEDMA
jgi:CRP/FNR family transcriptional regulator, nitrogen oxide reductase regulator